jgi:hypothetical protein
MAVLGGLIIGLLSAAPLANPLIGIWVLDEKAMRHEVLTSSLSAAATKEMTKPGFFTPRIIAFDESRMVSAVHGQCSEAVAYQYQHRDRGRVRVLMLGSDLVDWVTEFRVAGDALRLRMAHRGPITNVFRRVSIARVSDYPCIERELQPQGSAPASVLPAILTDEEAGSLAARLANHQAQLEYGMRPFNATDYALDIHEGRWIWGEMDPSTDELYTARVSFEIDGSRPRVRVRVQPPEGDFSNRQFLPESKPIEP